MEVSPVFYANLEALLDPNVKIIVNQGGTRSGKTYSIVQLLNMIQNKATMPTEISIVSQTLPHIKKGVLRDFKKIMYDLGMFEEKKFNGTDLIYKYTPSNYIEFFSADSGDKVRGPGRDYLFINEANLLSYDIWKQLLLRTRKKVIIDYNPSDEFHWIYDYVLTRSDVRFIKSTYKDNYDFLPQEQIDEIERLKNEDNNYWQIYGLGERAKSINLIYPNFNLVSEMQGDESIYGLDYGFNNQTALIEIKKIGQELYLKELIYKTGMTNSDLIDLLKTFNIGHKFIYADSADPSRTTEIYRAGFNIHPADKAVKPGIDFVKRFKLNVHKESINLQKELRSYKWKEDKNGHILEEPVKFMDHATDAIRYAAFTHGMKYWINAKSAFPSKFPTITDNSFRSILKNI